MRGNDARLSFGAGDGRRGMVDVLPQSVGMVEVVLRFPMQKAAHAAGKGQGGNGIVRKGVDEGILPDHYV